MNGSRSWPPSRRPSSSSTCCGRCCALRTSDRGRQRPPDARRRSALAILLVTPFLGSLHPPGDGGRADHPEPGPPPGRARRSTGSCGIDETAEQGWKGYAVSVLADGVRRDRRRLRASSDCRTSCRSTRTARIPPSRPTLRSTRRSASRRTRTGRTTPARPGASYLTQIGDARGAELHLGGDRAGHRDRSAPRPDPTIVRDDRQLLGRPDPRRSSTSCCRSPSSFAVVLVWQGVPQTFDGPADRHDPRGRASRRSPSARSRPRRSSRSWATTAAGSSTRTRPTRSRTRPPLTNCSRWFAIFAMPFALTYTFGRYAEGPASGLGHLRGDGDGVPGRAPSSRSERRCGGNPLFPAGVDQALGNMEGKETRFGAALGALLGGDHDEHEHRRDQRLARQLPADRRARPAAQHAARRGRHRGDRRRALRDARHRRHPGRLHRRPDGRADARVPGQEGRGLRDEDGDAGRARARLSASSASPRSRASRRRAWPAR